MTRTKELPKCTSSPHMRTGLPLRLTEREITSPDTSFPDRHWNTPSKPLSGPRMLTGSPQSQRERPKAAKLLPKSRTQIVSEETTT